MRDGLSDDYVTEIVQDKNGFIWLGTSNGLNRYDGRRIKQFFHEPGNPNSLISSRIWEMLVDDNNRIWINTPEGLCCYDQAQDRFIHFTHNPSNKNSLPVTLANNLFLAPDKKLWVSTYKGFYSVKNDLTLQKETVPVWKTGNITDTLKLIHPIYTDNNHQLWTYDEKNIYRLSSVMQPVEAYPYSIGSISCILQDKKNRYWITTIEGKLILLDTLTRQFREFKLPVKERSLHRLFQWEYKNKSWLLIPGLSLQLINVETLEAKSVLPNIYNKSGYQGTFWTKSFVDKDNRIWMGYERGCNVLQMNLLQTNIVPITLPRQIPYQEPDYYLTELFYADKQHYWVSTGVGIFKYDHQWQPLHYYKSLYPLSKTILNESSYPYECIRHGKYLYITGLIGLIELDLETNQTKIIQAPGNEQYREFTNIVLLSHDRFMLRTTRNGVFIYDLKLKKFIKHFKPSEKNENYIPDEITYLYKTRNGKILLTSRNGFSEFDSSENRFTKHILQNNSPQLPSPVITAMEDDSNGMMWIGTMKGICVYDPQNKMVVKLFNENREIGAVHTIVVDKKNNVWCNTRSRIWCWARYKQRWLNYSSLDGLPSEVYEGILQALPDSSIVAGIGEKIIRFSPDFLEPKREALADVYVTDVSTEKQDLNFTGKVNTQKKILLNPGENFFSVDFAVLNYDNPNAIKYLYKLEPSMNNFEENPSGHLTFTNLTPGKYRLIVKGSDKLGNRTNKEDTLEIIIKPYWHQTVWFWLLIAGAVAATVFLLVKRRIAVIRHEASLRRKMGETEMAALKAQMNPHFMFNCINSIDAFIHSNDKYNATLYLNKFAKLLRNILDSSKQNTVAFTKDIETLKLYIELEELRNDNKFKTIINIDSRLLDSDYKVPPLIIQPFVENAILHGLRNKDGNDGLLEIAIKQTGDKIEYIVKDNGIGRKAAALIAQNKEASYGVQLSNDRIRLFNKEEIASVAITDLFENNTARGTMVKIQLKVT